MERIPQSIPSWSYWRRFELLDDVHREHSNEGGGFAEESSFLTDRSRFANPAFALTQGHKRPVIEAVST